MYQRFQEYTNEKNTPQKTYQSQEKVKTGSITVFKSKVMWNLPLNHFDPGLTALIAYRVFVMEKPNAGKDIVSTYGAKHFQVVNMFRVVNVFQVANVFFFSKM